MMIASLLTAAGFFNSGVFQFNGIFVSLYIHMEHLFEDAFTIIPPEYHLNSYFN